METSGLWPMLHWERQGISQVSHRPSYRFDKKSYMSFPLVQISVTLNDPERRNGLYFALFHRIRVRRRRKTIVSFTSVSKYTFDSL